MSMNGKDLLQVRLEAGREGWKGSLSASRGGLSWC
jgi:hypothetical protein